MKWTIKSFVLAALLLLVVILPVAAGSPHFVFVDISVGTESVSATGKIAGLGDEAQVHVVLTATADCINGGGNHPKSHNKTTVTAAGDFPNQNGMALFSLSATAVFQPPCSPPMAVRFSDVRVTDTTHGITYP